MLANLTAAPADPLWQLTDAYRIDPRAQKIDLVVGVYRNEAGITPVMDIVRQAEHRLAEAARSKAYRALSGNAEFNAGMARLLLGENNPRLDCQYTIQTVGGTGALRVLADFIAIAAPTSTVWSSNPGYINHQPIMTAAGLGFASYRWVERDGVLDTQAILADLARAKTGDIVLLHGCCHNPTGIDMPLDAWRAIAELCVERGLVPLVDMAYQGFGDGLEEDAQGLRLLVSRLDTVLVAASCSKNMGLYCERTGVACVIGSSPAALRNVGGTLERIARSNYSMPPDHGAAIAAMLLADRNAWQAELEGMRQRVANMRALLGNALVRNGAPDSMLGLARHKGMFSLLPLSPDAMVRLRREFGIYGTQNGRINIAGLRTDQVETLAAALVAVSACERECGETRMEEVGA